LAIGCTEIQRSRCCVISKTSDKPGGSTPRLRREAGNVEPISQVEPILESAHAEPQKKSKKKDKGSRRNCCDAEKESFKDEIVALVVERLALKVENEKLKGGLNDLSTSKHAYKEGQEKEAANIDDDIVDVE